MRGRTIDCPDCKRPVFLRETDQGLTGEKGTKQTLKTNINETAVELPYPKSNSIGKWIVVSGFIVTVIVIAAFSIFSGNTSNRKEPEDKNSLIVDNDMDGTNPNTTSPDSANTNPDQGDPETDERAIAAKRLERIYQLIEKFQNRNQTFPASRYGEMADSGDRFSWIAKLDRDWGDGAVVDWEQPWHAAVNDPFIRRRLEMFSNPDSKRQIGDDLLPASHFVGVSGVGPDAGKHPIGDPRRGIFGVGPSVTFADVKDGTANTMLIAGAQDQLGSWAKPGRATVRSFHHEPYINGPDGFGTGQKDGMFVLMADGNVRFLNAKTDPVVIRRMAAMSDGYTLDPTVAGDPLADGLKLDQQKSVAGLPPTDPEMPNGKEPDDEPITVPIAPDVPLITLEERLGRTIARYELERPVSLIILLTEIEELLGTPIDRSELTTTALDRPVILQLEETTIGELLDAIAKASQTKVELTKNSIKVVEPSTK